jgi:hypothetical protein
MSFQFVEIVNPAQVISTKSRSHVMREYLRRRQCKANYDIELWASSERNRTQSLATITKPQKARNPPTFVPTDSQLSSNLNPHSYENNYSRYFHAIAAIGESLETIHDTAGTQNDNIEIYLLGLMSKFDALGPQRCIGSEIDPFHTLPQINKPLISIEKLKKYCKFSKCLLIT